MAKKTASVDPNALLNSLTGTAKKKETGATKKKVDCYLEGGEELQRAVDEFAASDIIAGIAKDQREADAQHLKGLAFESYVVIWAEQGAKPENPLITSQHSSVRFQVKDLLKPALPPDSDQTPEAVQELLLAQGLTEEVASQVASCVKVQSNLVTKPLDQLLADGTPAEKEAAQALMKLAVDNLTEEQRGLLFETKPQLVVDAARIAANLSVWCKGKAELMTLVLSVLPPQLALSQAKHDNALAVASKRFEEARKAERK
jgi:hypothetical protein